MDALETPVVKQLVKPMKHPQLAQDGVAAELFEKKTVQVTQIKWEHLISLTAD